MGKTLKYGDFKFGSDFGFTGSAGKQMVKGYARGGGVKKYANGDLVQGDDAESQIQSIINNTKDMKVPAQKRPAKSTLPADPTPAEAAEMDAIMKRTNGGVNKDPQSNFKKGGSAKHDDAKQDKALVKSMVKPDALKARGGAMVKKRGVPVAPKAPLIAPQRPVAPQAAPAPMMAPPAGGLKMGGKASKKC